MLCVCMGEVMEVVFSVCIVWHGAVGARECFVMQMLYVSVLCASCGSSQCCVLHDMSLLMLETNLDSSIFSSKVLSKGCVGEFRRDRNLNGGGGMIMTKDCYTITNLVLQTAPKMRQNWSGPP